ncbi:RHS repeat-associated core domain-containing protein [Streptomyces daliensis]|uniref:RHS repeat-associated core domain-containing protein n=1 Tax=Streptomyces daliensis TaxID=299421 RepID=A0A8T4IS62_9ACTN|nr:RHS repeat-associated core domain-containing protein [Streptomyces daliensis]
MGIGPLKLPFPQLRPYPRLVKCPDPETGLHYNYFRHYDPETARYLSPDPLGLEAAPNPVTYVANPHAQTDFFGLAPEYPDDLPELFVDDAKFGKKWGKHAQDYGLDPSDANARMWYRDRINEIHRAPDEIRKGDYHPNGGGGPDHWFYVKDGDQIILRPDGTFVSLFPPDRPTGWFKNAVQVFLRDGGAE